MKVTLKKYLFREKLQMYEIRDSIKSEMINDNFTKEDEKELARVEAKLEIINDIIEICTQRNRY